MVRTTIRYPLIFIIATLIFTASCERNVVFTGSHVMPARTWDITDVPSFDVPVNDTVTREDLMFNIRTGPSYPFRNIFLFVSVTSPEGKTLTDTLQYYLTDDKGKWYGKGLGDLHELSLPYRTNVFFPRKGIYQFRIQHGMRVENLKGVYDFGMRIEKHK